MGELGAALPAGVGAAISVLAVAGHRRDSAASWLARRRRAADHPHPTASSGRARVPLARLRAGVASASRRAGWEESPERLLGGTGLAAGAAALAVGGAAFAAGNGALGALGAAVGACAGVVLGAGLLLVRVQARRREALLAELCPLLELVSLELSAGSSPRASFGAVVSRLRGDLARELQGLLIGSQVAGSRTFEARLGDLAEELKLEPLAGLGAILASSREYGISVGPGVRALAADLRRRQRRRLIVISRRALNRVLIPAAVGVLLPFMAILMFPAVSTLVRSFP
ncbi:MAG: hypothetical protein ACREPI_07575 [Candidatus Dormibacterales bacterium]